ncbi:hypothetical protein Hdeb2414_s0146g00813301 [Helianthus debilis subsp. tardiflorus]
MISATELQNRLRKVGGEEVQLSDEEAEMSDEEAEEAEEGGRGGGLDGWLSFVLID